MKNAIVLISLVILGILLSHCKKNSDGVDLSIKLVNAQDQEISAFHYGDTVVYFKFTLYNNSSKSITIDRSSTSFSCFSYLKVYMENPYGKYEYIGRPSVAITLIYEPELLESNQKKIIDNIPIVRSLNWPDLNQGSYYVGDTLKLKIDNEYHNYYSRIYFFSQVELCAHHQIKCIDWSFILNHFLDDINCLSITFPIKMTISNFITNFNS